MNEPVSSGRNNLLHDDQGWSQHEEGQSEEGVYTINWTVTRGKMGYKRPNSLGIVKIS